jgi:hypothetical protein
MGIGEFIKMLMDNQKEKKVKYIDKAIEESKVECVKCIKCGMLHSAISPGGKEKFFSVHGNICIGLNGGIVGNNLNEDGQVNRVMVYCFNCLIKYLQENISPDRNPVISDEDILSFGDDDEYNNAVCSTVVGSSTTEDCVIVSRRAIGVDGVASEIGALGRTTFTVDRDALVSSLQRRFYATVDEAESAINQAKKVNVVVESDNKISLVMHIVDNSNRNAAKADDDVEYQQRRRQQMLERQEAGEG